MIDLLDEANRTINLEDYYQTWLPFLQESLAKAITTEGNFKDGRVGLARNKHGTVVGIDVYVVPIEPVSYISLKSVVLPEGVKFHVSTD